MRLKMNKILIFFYISFSISIAQRPITSEDIVNLKTVSQASFHSDGSKIVYIKSIPSAKDGDKRLINFSSSSKCFVSLLWTDFAEDACSSTIHNRRQPTQAGLRAAGQ